jgi:hypothetical protein
MCGFGVCMMCRSNKAPSATSLDTANAATPPAALGAAITDQNAASDLNCCHGEDRAKTEGSDGARVA